MADERERIDVEQAEDRSYWTRKLGVSEHVLQEAVDRVGPVAQDVERILKGRPRRTREENDSPIRAVTDELGITTPRSAED